MPEATEPQAAPRERGWRSVLLALAAFLLVPAMPLLPTLLPVERTLVLLVPAVAACALVAWLAGGRLSVAVTWTALAVLVLATRQAPASPGFDVLARGWALLLAAAFGFVCLVARKQRFLGRALAAFGIALGLALAAIAVARTSPTRVAGIVGTELATRGARDLERWQTSWSQPEQRQRLAQEPRADSLVTAIGERIAALPQVSTAVFPALLGLESLLALALAWAIFHRISRVRLGAPLAPLREFRFNDQLVWGLVVGITMVLLPSLVTLRGLGANLLVFFGALYALRGAGVVAFFMAPGWASTLAVGVCMLLFGKYIAIGAFGLGLGDTWLDWRTRHPRPTT